jgi:hypothetical protein
VNVHSVLPVPLSASLDEVLAAACVRHVVHEMDDPVGAAVSAAEDPAALALVGPFRSADVSEALAATAPAGLPLMAPVATWAGITRHDEPGCDDAAEHRGTVFRLVARDTEVAMRVAGDVRKHERRALVLAGEHEYGRQLDGQLRLAGLPRVDDAADADLVVLCGLADGPEVKGAMDLSPLPVIAFDGVQGAALGSQPNIALALPFAPVAAVSHHELFSGVTKAHEAAELIASCAAQGVGDRQSTLVALRNSGRFDEHGDPIDPDVWLWRADSAWDLVPERSLAMPASSPSRQLA